MLLNFYGNFRLLNFSLLTDGKFCFDSDASNTFVCQPYCMLPEAFTKIDFPEERNAFVLDLQHGRRDVTCKPAITLNFRNLVFSRLTVFLYDL